jgi:uncharacterized protein YpmB
MIKRGGASFAILFIINPIVILFYQNCSVIPVHSKKTQAINEVQTKNSRQIAANASLYESSQCRFLSSNYSCAE